VGKPRRASAKRSGSLRLKLAYWLFVQLGNYIQGYAEANRTEAIVAVQGPGVLMIDGTWMPDRVSGIQQ
jgi:hypothetical protein